jgi:hypothetical protein
MKFKVSGTVKTQRGATDAEGKMENFVETYDVENEESAKAAWKKEVSSDLTNMDWSITGCEAV